MVSRGFSCTLAGVAITVFAWFSPWLWPGWPGVPVMGYITTRYDFVAWPYATKGATIVVVMILNIAWWALVAYTATRATAKFRHAK